VRGSEPGGRARAVHLLRWPYRQVLEGGDRVGVLAGSGRCHLAPANICCLPGGDGRCCRPVHHVRHRGFDTDTAVDGLTAFSLLQVSSQVARYLAFLAALAYRSLPTGSPSSPAVGLPALPPSLWTLVPRRVTPGEGGQPSDAAKHSDRGPPGSYGSTSIAPTNVTRAQAAFPPTASPGGMATMRSWIDHAGEVIWEPAPSLIAQFIEAGQPFWLDIENPTDELINQLASRLGLHPLAVEDSKQFGQRAKLQVYGNAVMLVGFGLDERLREPVEVHCYYTTGFLVTLRRAPSPALDALRHAGSVQPQLGSDPIRALHPVISSLYTQFSALALELDERLDVLEQRVLHEADDQELAEITTIEHRASVTRRILTPGRDLAARTPLIQSLPGATSETQLYAEDINDELQQVVADFTALEQRCAALLVLHASLASKHLAVVSRRLADVATIFLPISFLAGFWGENFNVLTGSIEKGWPAFLVLGVGLSVACVLVIVIMLSRRSWK
jgi:magnesium transporter